jgi:hypothetical protein
VALKFVSSQLTSRDEPFNVSAFAGISWSLTGSRIAPDKIYFLEIFNSDCNNNKNI